MRMLLCGPPLLVSQSVSQLVSQYVTLRQSDRGAFASSSTPSDGLVFCFFLSKEMGSDELCQSWKEMGENIKYFWCGKVVSSFHLRGRHPRTMHILAPGSFLCFHLLFRVVLQKTFTNWLFCFEIPLVYVTHKV